MFSRFFPSCIYFYLYLTGENIGDSVTKTGLRDKSRQKGCKSRKKIQRPDTGFSWVVAFASFFVSMISDGVVFSYGVITPEFIKHFGVSRSTVGWMGSLLMSINLATGPLASYLSEKFRYRIVSVAGSLIASISFGLPYFYSEVWFIFLTSSILTGIGLGLVYFPSIVIVNVWFEEKRSLALGIAVCGSGLGAFILSPVLQLLIENYGWQLTMLITGCVLLLLIPFCMAYKDRITGDEVDEEEAANDKDKEKENMEVEICDNRVSREGHISGEIKKATFLELLKNPILWLYLISNFLTSIGSNSPYMFTKDRAFLAGFTEIKASYLISAIGIGNCFGRLLFGYLGTLKCVNRFHVYNLTLIVSGLALVVSWFIKNYVLMILYNLVFGIMTGPFMTLSSVLCVDIFGLNNVDNTLGLVLMFQGIAVLVGPPISGWIFDITESFNITFAVCGIFIIISGLIMYLAYISKDFRKTKFC